MRGDWVYRGQEYRQDTGVAAATQVASYIGARDRTVGPYVLSPGTPLGVILYDSQDYLTQGTQARVGGGNPLMMNKAARSDGKRATVLAVDAQWFLIPNAWTVGANFAVGARIVICDQNMTTGALDLPAGYRMTGLPTFDNDPALYANGWGNLAERWDYIAFQTGNETVRWKFRLRWRGRRTLQPNQCLGLYLESAPPAVGSTTLNVTPVCRSLVHDPNA